MVTLELLWPAILTLLMSILTTLLAMRYRRVMNDLQTRRKSYRVELTSYARDETRENVASQEPQRPESRETNYTAMDANSLKNLTTTD